MKLNENNSREIIISRRRIYLLAFAVIPPTITISVVLHYWIWKTPATGNVGTFNFLVIFVLSLIVHELLHGFGFWYFGKASWKDIRFGIDWKGFVPYADCKACMSARAYRMTGALPGLVLGVVPTLFGLATGIGWFTWYGAIMLGASAGDFAILWTIRALSGSDVVQRDPEKFSSLFVSPANPTISNI